jgi:hypothetical protein
LGLVIAALVNVNVKQRKPVRQRIFNQTGLLMMNKQLSFVSLAILDDSSLLEVIPAFHTLVR